MKNKELYRSDIQGLRAIAVILVWIFHINHQWLPGGFVGVDVFFVISGYLISQIIWKQKEKGTFSFFKFYSQRIRRILPAYYLMILVALLCTIFIYFGLDVQRGIFIKALLFVSNIHFSSFNDYFGAKSYELPLLHTWTLSIEMQFYFLLPILLIWFRKQRIILLFIFSSLLLFLFSQYYLTQGYNQQVYFSLAARTPEFLLGVILAGSQSQIRIRNLYRSTLSVIGLTCIISSAFLYSDQTLFPGLSVLLPCLGTILVLVGNGSFGNKLLSNKLMIFIGNISYSIYLWHWVILSCFRYFINEYYLSISQNLILACITLGASFVSYQYIECRFQKAKLSSVFKYLVCVGIAIVSLTLLMKPLNRFIYPYDRFPDSIVSSEGIDAYNHASYRTDKIWGDTLASDTFLLLGDSHAMVMKPFLDILGKEVNFSFRSITNNSYPTFPGFDRVAFHSNKHYEEYEALMPPVELFLKKSDLILLVTTYYKGSPGDYLKAFETIDSIITDTQDVILISDYPVLDDNPIQSNRSIFRSSSKTVNFGSRFVKPPVEVIDFINRHSNFHYLDLTDSQLFHSEQFPYYNDTIMYYNEGHLNNYGSIKYAQYAKPKFISFINQLRNR